MTLFPILNAAPIIQLHVAAALMPSWIGRGAVFGGRAPTLHKTAG